MKVLAIRASCHMKRKAYARAVEDYNVILSSHEVWPRWAPASSSLLCRSAVAHTVPSSLTLTATLLAAAVAALPGHCEFIQPWHRL